VYHAFDVIFYIIIIIIIIIIINIIIIIIIIMPIADHTARSAKTMFTV